VTEANSFSRAIPFLFLWLFIQPCSAAFADDGDCARFAVAVSAPETPFDETLRIVGTVLVNGTDGIEKDPIEGAICIREAAQRGNAQAQAQLAALYGLGLGLPQDWVHAHMWASVAAIQGFDGEETRSFRDQIAEEMTAEELAESQRLVQEWLARR